MSGIRLEQITGSNFSYQHLPFERFLDDMVELGRERVELWGIAPQLHVPQLSNEEARGIRRRIDERGLAVHCLTPEQVIYPVNVASPVACTSGRMVTPGTVSVRTTPRATTSSASPTSEVR